MVESNDQENKVNNILLVVEDNEDDQLITKMAFKKDPNFQGEIYFVENGVEALDFINNRNKFEDQEKYPDPDLILVDINMPQMNGLQFLDNIKTDPKHKKIPCIMLTSSQNKDDITSSYEKGASGYIAKPISYTKFQDIVKIINEYWKFNILPSK
jgi:CheY-like chemotaxis protein